MGIAAGGIVLEIAAEHLVPLLVTEVSSHALRHAARHVARSASARARSPQAPRAPAPLGLAPRTTILSQVPGRVRLQVSGLRGDAARAGRTAARLRALPGVQAASINPLTGSALVQYDPTATELGRIRAALEVVAPVGRRQRMRGHLLSRRSVESAA